MAQSDIGLKRDLQITPTVRAAKYLNDPRTKHLKHHLTCHQKILHSHILMKGLLYTTFSKHHVHYLTLDNQMLSKIETFSIK
jgi:formamidopyrimidine-DNA glycosylase